MGLSVTRVLFKWRVVGFILPSQLVNEPIRAIVNSSGFYFYSRCSRVFVSRSIKSYFSTNEKYTFLQYIKFHNVNQMKI